MKAFYILTTVVFVIIAFSSCEKVIDLNLKNAEPQLVIEGSVSNVTGFPLVKISRSVRFDEPNNFPGVSGAVVTMTSGNSPVSLVETSPGVYQAPAVVGRPGRSYTLKVDLEGQTYNATSTMPNPVDIDSIMIEQQSFRGENTKTVVVYYTDPPTVANQYRFIMAVNGVLIKEVFARNDEFNNGRPARVALYQDDVKIKSGDVIELEMLCIDERVYRFWFTLARQGGNGMGNGSVAPANPPNNFDRPVLGYFSAHAQSKRTISVR